MKLNKILISLPNDSMGGAEQYLYELCSYLSKFNKITVVFLKQPKTNFWNNNLVDENIRLIYLNATSEKKGFFELIRWSFWNKDEFQFALTSHIQLNGVISFLRKYGLLNINYHIARESTFIFDRFKGLKLLQYKTFYRMGYSHLDLLITQSENMRLKLLKGLRNKINSNIVRTIPNLLNIESITEKGNKYVPIHKNYIVSAGRLIPEKGYEVLINSYNIIKDKLNNSKLIILGEGKERPKLEMLIKNLKLQDKVDLIGYKENPMPYFKNAKLCVVSSIVEGFPNVLLQMMLLNDKVVSTLCAGGIDELEYIETCEINSSNALADAMLKRFLMKQDNSESCKNQLESRNVDKYWNQIIIYLNND